MSTATNESTTDDSRDNNNNNNTDEVAFRASEYRTGFFRQSRDATNALDETRLGPTQVKALPWSAHLVALLCGVRDDTHPLHVLSGYESTLVKRIYEMLVDTWREHIILTPPAHAVGRAVPVFAWNDDEDITEEDYQEHSHVLVDCARFHATAEDRERLPRHWLESSHVTRLGRNEESRPEVAFSLVGTVKFPKPTGRNVNMLPFIMGDVNSLPEDLRPYYDPLISQCPVMDEEYGKVVYLTVSEGMVEASLTQRRSGLHVEAVSGIRGLFDGKLLAGAETNWGGGVHEYVDDAEPDQYNGGLYMASNMNDTCEIWDALVQKGQGIVDFHGGGEHLRPFIGAGTKLRANELAWLTDRTPHEALPQPEDGYRQFFRLVTSNISVWFRQHSTVNPAVPVPDHVLIVEDNKFLASSSKAKMDHQCRCCGSLGKKLKKCGRCKVAKYCGSACQKKDWKLHKTTCKAAPTSCESHATIGQAVTPRKRDRTSS